MAKPNFKTNVSSRVLNASEEFLFSSTQETEAKEKDALKPEKATAKPTKREPIKEGVGGWEQVEKKEQRYNKHINLMVQEFTRDKLDDYAKEEGKSRNDLINTILKNYIKERG